MFVVCVCRTNSSQLLVELKKFTAGKEGGELGSSLDSKYSKFYLGQLKTMNSRHVRSRFAAASLLASLKQSPSAGTSTLLDLAAQVVQAIDQVRSATKVDMLAPEVSSLISSSNVLKFSLRKSADSGSLFSANPGRNCQHEDRHTHTLAA
jgi:hypothetical protein